MRSLIDRKRTCRAIWKFSLCSSRWAERATATASLQPPDQPGEQQGDNGDGDDSNPVEQGGGKYEPANQIIDEATYYRDVFGQYYDLIVEYLSSGEELPEDLRIIIEAYFNILK